MGKNVIDVINKKIEDFNDAINSHHVTDPKNYLTELKLMNFKDDYDSILKLISQAKFPIFSLKKYSIKNALRNSKDTLDKLKIAKDEINNKYLNMLKKEIPVELKRINDKLLDEHQLNSIIIDEKNILVIAGAGTGKTTTITGKIKYLLLKEKVNPEEVLLLTYTKNASEEMRIRVEKETGVNLDVFTFHKLGKDIITSVEGKVPNLTNISLNELIRDAINYLIENSNEYRAKLIQYLFYNQYLGKTQFDFEDNESYQEYIKLHPLTTLKNEVVKSYEELSIANYLTLNGIDYKYENKYIIQTNNSDYGQYHPDFYLPQYNLWIEHFGISKSGDVPLHFRGKGQKSAKQIYNEGIKWKRMVHKENSTKLIETYSYENFDGVLLSNLKVKLEKNGVLFRDIDYKQVLKNFFETNKSLMNGLNELFSTVISLLRLNKISVHEFNSMRMNLREDELKKLIVPIYKHYEKALSDNNEIDFNDMLNRATDYVLSGRYKSKYKYVIVDEFQDMTKSTYSLLKALRKSQDYKLYAVGDDWQSIYRFAGSDVGYITNFKDHFGLSEIFFIPNTYRFSQSIANVAGGFVVKNPAQIKKCIRSSNKGITFDVGLINGCSRESAIQFLEDKLDSLPINSDVLFLGRYNYDIKQLNNSFTIRYDTASQLMIIKYLKRNDLRIVFRSIHAAKGLEADYVFILNNKKGNYGFPSTIQETSILNYFLSSKDNYAFSEERRLMYVALTRAKKKVWLITNNREKSVFIDELNSEYSEDFKKEQFECPKCGGQLSLKSSSYGKFFGCSNYPECKYTKNIIAKNI